jgi:hypothetical protein
MSAIQKSDRLLTLKHDSKQIDRSITNKESTYFIGNKMANVKQTQSTQMADTSSPADLETKLGSHSSSKLRRRFQPLVAVLKTQPKLLDRISRIDVSDSGLISFHLEGLPLKQAPEGTNEEIEAILRSMN